MARARRKTETKAPAAAAATGTAAGELTCPECGKTFGRAAALGAHRRRAHGVTGSSSPTRSRQPSTRTVRSRSTAPANNSRRRSNGAGRGVDRDGLLATLFPNGLPAREAVIRAANRWLDEAEQLAAMK